MSDFNKSTNNLSMEVDSKFPYSPPSMRCQRIIEYTFIRFHSDVIEHPIKIFSDEETEYKFGILDIKIRTEIPIISKHTHIFFTIDASASMRDMCSDGRKKIDHIHHTLENMLRIFHENKECNISVHVQSFDTNVNTIIKNVPDIRESDIEKLILLSHKIIPNGSTNIEAALKNATTEISNYRKINPNDEIVHIFLTDGDITNGSNDYDLLLELVPNDCTNIFIGYGIEHNSQLLSHLSKKKGNEYRFIDALEKAGIVYGEIIHGLLYKAIEDVSLTVISGELYDYQTNTWVTSLQIGNLLSEQLKTFHVRSINTLDCNVSIYGKPVVQTRQFETINIYGVQATSIPILFQSSSNDLSVYIFRQKTQELLYNARKISEQSNIQNISFNYIYLNELRNQDSFTKLYEQSKNIKQELSEFHKIMLNYMKEKHLENDPMLKMLCDDIYISYKTTGTSLGFMYNIARQTSNGRQQTYMCSATHTQELYNNSLPEKTQLHRQTNLQNVNFSTQTDVFTFIDDFDPPVMNFADEIDSYVPTQDFLSPFSSDGVVTLMREVSGNYSIGRTIPDNEDDKEETAEN